MADSLTHVTSSPGAAAGAAMVERPAATRPLEVAMTLIARQDAAVYQEQERTQRSFMQLTTSVQEHSRAQAEKMQTLEARLAALLTRVEASDAVHEKTVAELRAAIAAQKQTIEAQTKVIDTQARTILQQTAELSTLKAAVDVLQRTEYRFAILQYPMAHLKEDPKDYITISKHETGDGTLHINCNGYSGQCLKLKKIVQ